MAHRRRNQMIRDPRFSRMSGALICATMIFAFGATVRAEQPAGSANPTATEIQSAVIACPKAMPADVEKKLLPVLDALKEANRDWSSGYETRSEQNYESQFERLLAAKDSASRQARVAMMDYYGG